MNQLLEKFNEYKSIVNYMIAYEFEDGNIIEFTSKQTDFPHLIGLHKLIDIPIIRQFNDKSNQTVSAKFLIFKIKKENNAYRKYDKKKWIMSIIFCYKTMLYLI